MFHLQSPDEILDYSQVWSEWVEVGDELSGSTWTITPSDGVTLVDFGFAAGESSTSVSVSNLTPGVSYQLTNTVTTAGARTGQRDKILRCARY